MAPNLQGLNLVHPVQNNSDPHDLLSGQFHPDLAAQLDLWTNLAFDDEVAHGHDEDKHRKRTINEEEEDEPTSHGSSTSESAVHDGHVNVVTGTNIMPNNLGAPPSLHPTHGFDLNSFLTSFNIPPSFSLPPLSHPQQVPQASGIAPSLAQLIALHSSSGAPSFAAPPPPQSTSTPVAPVSTANQNRSKDDNSPPAAKRHRARKASEAVSISSPGSPATESPSGNIEGKEGMDGAPSTVAAAEDKRRRNTAASARFRLKKKEREAALENKAKELEARVNELERECEGLRRENGWLKGLVVGVTGAAQAPVVGGTKRPRDEA